jgi:hypothetical protein
VAIERKYIRGDGVYFAPTCDLCGDALPDEISYEDACNVMKKARWRSRKDDFNDWQNVCTDCLKLEKENLK